MKKDLEKKLKQQQVAGEGPHPRKEKKKELHLYPWHFFEEHRKRGKDGKWELDFDK